MEQEHWLTSHKGWQQLLSILIQIHEVDIKHAMWDTEECAIDPALSQRGVILNMQYVKRYANHLDIRSIVITGLRNWKTKTFSRGCSSSKTPLRLQQSSAQSTVRVFLRHSALIQRAVDLKVLGMSICDFCNNAFNRKEETCKDDFNRLPLAETSFLGR
jgi:hypothetical protein